MRARALPVGRALLVAGCLSILVAGCGRIGDPCEQAADHVASCLGIAPDPAAAPVCDAERQARAEEVLGLSCEQIPSPRLASSGKSDGFFCTLFGWWCKDKKSVDPQAEARTACQATFTFDRNVCIGSCIGSNPDSQLACAVLCDKWARDRLSAECKALLL